MAADPHVFRETALPAADKNDGEAKLSGDAKDGEAKDGDANRDGVFVVVSCVFVVAAVRGTPSSSSSSSVKPKRGMVDLKIKIK